MQQIISQFQLSNPVLAPKPVSVGLINQSYALPSAIEGGVSYFLQRINHHIFTDVDGLQRNIQLVTDHIRAKLMAQRADDIERRVLQLIPTKEGKLYHKTAEGDYWRMYVMIPYAISHNQVTPQAAQLAGEAFAVFQEQLADLPADQLCESIPHFHDMEFRLQQLREAVKEDRVGRKKECHNLLFGISSRIEEMCLPERLYSQGLLPKRINHCDTKVNNMMFDQDGHPLCIVDLDTVMPGFVLSDFGDFMRTAANTGAEDDPNLENIGVNMEIFESYTRGYLKCATFLTPKERELLPLGCRRMSYMQCVRFLTDYLNGDTYYKIDYPEHNLVRAKAQFRLLEQQEAARPQMKAIISK